MDTVKTPKHTPGPWKLEYHPTSGRFTGDVLAPNGSEICTTWGHAQHRELFDKEANAAYIAHACNLHPELVRALKAVCHALAAWRDGEDVNLEELKYMIVDRAIECAEPGFDGGTTTADELRANIAEWRARLTQAEGMEDR